MADPGQSMALTEWLALFGVKAVTLVAAFFGATVAMVGTPTLTFPQLVLSVTAGTAFSVYVEPLATYLFGFPPAMQGAVAFFLGLGGLVLCAGVLQVRELPQIALAWVRKKFGGES